jgi:hypothetical protein
MSPVRSTDSMLRALVLCGALGACQRGDSNTVAPAVDTVLTREVDVDGDGTPDSVRLHLTAQRFDQPFTHALTIVSNGRAILERSTTDDWDQDFADTSFTAPCAGYDRCKREWYFTEYLNTVIQAPAQLGEGAFVRSVGGNIYDVAVPHLTRQCGATHDEAVTAVDSAVVRLKSGRVPIVFDNVVPVQLGTPTAWFPEFGCFAPVHGE